jgi:hypothetical protein
MSKGSATDIKQKLAFVVLSNAGHVSNSETKLGKFLQQPDRRSDIYNFFLVSLLALMIHPRVALIAAAYLLFISAAVIASHLELTVIMFARSRREEGGSDSGRHSDETGILSYWREEHEPRDEIRTPDSKSSSRDDAHEDMPW